MGARGPEPPVVAGTGWGCEVWGVLALARLVEDSVPLPFLPRPSCLRRAVCPGARFLDAPQASRGRLGRRRPSTPGGWVRHGEPRGLRAPGPLVECS